MPLPRPLLLAALGVAALAGPARAQYPKPDSVGLSVPTRAPAASAEANRSDDPNRVPYATRTNVGAHALALPATLWRGLADAVGAGVRWAEGDGVIDWLLYNYGGGAAPRYGVTPFLDVGGQNVVIVGATAYHNDVFGTGRRAEVGGRIGARDVWGVHGAFLDASLLGSRVGLRLDGDYFRDTEKRFYAVGNDAGEDERIAYEMRRGTADAAFAFPLPAHLTFGVDARYEHVEVFEGENGLDPSGTPGFGRADLLSAGGRLVLDLGRRSTLHAPRLVGGTVLLVGYRYGRDVHGRNYAYHRVEAEARQYVPLPLLPFNRRLALRARLEKTHPPGDHAVPFYELPTLGGPATLRAFPSGRFRDEGYLLLQAEYRYPIWEILDAALFADAGQVFQRYGEIAPADFHTGAGFGLHLYGARGVAGRLELAFGGEGPRLLAQVGATF